MESSRRRVLQAGISMVGAASTPAICFAACSPALPPTESIAGPPEYLAGAPTRTSFLRPGLPGQRVRVFGQVLTTNCAPVVNARLDFWHADIIGRYDFAGYSFRGCQRTDEQGRFLLETVMPGQYNGPRHIHFFLSKRQQEQLQPQLLSGVIYTARDTD